MKRLEFETNVPVVVRFPFGGQPKDADPTEYGSYYYGVEAGGERQSLYASALLSQTISAASIGKGEEALIMRGEKKVASADGKRRTLTFWKVEHGTAVYVSDALDGQPTKQMPPQQPATVGSPPAEAPSQPQDIRQPAASTEAPPSQEEQPYAGGNGHHRAPSYLPAQLGATLVVAFDVARVALTLAGLTPTEEAIGTTGRGLEIDLVRAGWIPRPEKVAEFIHAMREERGERI